jgi:hypothetical protein
MNLVQALVLVGLLGAPTPPDIGGGTRRPSDAVHGMTEADVDSLTPTTGDRQPVAIASLELQLADPRNREAFRRGFDGAFGERALRTERLARRTGAPVPGDGLLNRFRLAEPGEEGAAWTVRVGVAWTVPPPDSGQRPDSLALRFPGLGALVTLEAREPGEPRPAARPVPTTTALRFPPGHPVDPAYYQHAGRQIGLVVLERLHRAQGLLGDDQRVRLEDASRTPATAPR